MRKVFPIIGIAAGLYWIIAGLFVYDFWVRKGPGGGFMPVLAGILALVFGIKTLIQNSKDKSPSVFSWKAMVPVAALAALVLSSYVLGLIVSIAIFIFVWMKFVEKFKTVRSAVTGILTAAALYGIFGLWLKVALPQGLLGIL